MKSWKYVLTVAATATVTGCFTGDPNAYSATPVELADAMRGKSSSYKDGKKTRTMRVTSGSEKGVYVALSADGGSGRTCRIRFEPVDEGTTRIVPDCGKDSSPSGQLLVDFAEIKVLEQAKHILTGEPVNVAMLENARMATAMKAIPKVQAEARAQMKEIAATEAKMRDSAGQSSDWGN